MGRERPRKDMYMNNNDQAKNIGSAFAKIRKQVEESDVTPDVAIIPVDTNLKDKGKNYNLRDLIDFWEAHHVNAKRVLMTYIESGDVTFLRWRKWPEEKPENKNKYIVRIDIDNRKSVRIWRYISSGWKEAKGYTNVINDEIVTHWMPLPELPKEGSKS